MSNDASVFLVSIYEQSSDCAFETKEVHIVSELECHAKYSCCAATNAVYILLLQLYIQHKQQAAFLHILVIKANATLKRQRLLRLRTLQRKHPRLF